MWDKLFSISLEVQETVLALLEKRYNEIGSINNKSDTECFQLFCWFYAGSAILDVSNRMNIDYGLRCGKRGNRIDGMKYYNILKQQINDRVDLPTTILKIPYEEFFLELEPEINKLISKYDIISVNVFLFNLKRTFL